MSNPAFIGVIANGEYKIAQYAKMAGYPTCEGAGVLGFLTKANLDVFKKKLANCRYATQEEINQCMTNAGIDPAKAMDCTLDEAERFEEMYPNLSVETGSAILAVVYNSNGEVLLTNAERFLNDETWCDYAYIINLDDNTLKCYAYGTKHLFGEYALENLPSVEEMDGDYVKTMKEAYGDDYFEEDEEE